mmetsp:Transcript_59764/g.159943  ORF Transcript_59764/g.159943 Transcript_59764/m.159943 type:complete len:232 (+) Transcript_59764:642-1337(+)
MQAPPPGRRGAASPSPCPGHLRLRYVAPCGARHGAGVAERGHGAPGSRSAGSYSSGGGWGACAGRVLRSVPRGGVRGGGEARADAGVRVAGGGGPAASAGGGGGGEGGSAEQGPAGGGWLVVLPRSGSQYREQDTQGRCPDSVPGGGRGPEDAVPHLHNRMARRGPRQPMVRVLRAPRPGASGGQRADEAGAEGYGEKLRGEAAVAAVACKAGGPVDGAWGTSFDYRTCAG